MSGNGRDGDGDGEGAMVWVRPSSRHVEAIPMSRCVPSGRISHQSPSYARPSVSYSAENRRPTCCN